MKEKKHFTKFYMQYINSEKWREKRKYIAELHNYTCQNCGKKVLKGYQVHHLTYTRLGNEDDKDLMFLCQDCHERIHNMQKFKPKKEITFFICYHCNTKLDLNNFLKESSNKCPYCNEIIESTYIYNILDKNLKIKNQNKNKGKKKRCKVKYKGGFQRYG